MFRVVICGLAVVAGCSNKKSEPAKQAVPRDGGVAKVAVDAPPGKISSPLPEQGPHPDYPTPVASGTDKIFTLEDPDRGAKVEPTFDLEAISKDLTWTTHALCVPDTVDVLCSTAATPPLWRVGRGKNVVVALSKLPIENSHVYLAKPDGAPDRYIEIDSYGRVESASTFTPTAYANRLPRGANGLAGCGSMAYTLDKQRRVERLKCLQWSGDPMRDTRGVAATKYERDPKSGGIVAYHYEGMDGKPAANVDNVAIERFELDANGRTAVVRYRDVNDQPVQTPAGCHGYRYERNGNGALVKQTCLDGTNQPVANVSGVAITTYKVDANGCRTGWRYQTKDGAATTGGANIHGYNLEVDKHCAELARTCLNIVEQPLACGIGAPAKYVYVRDANGQITAQKHYLADGKPGGDSQYKAFEVRYVLDDLGRRVGESCYDADNKPKQCGTTGFHAKRTTYDDAGRTVEERFYDTAGSPTTNLGTSIRRFQYDNYDHIFERKSLDANGEVIESMGQSTRRDLYDVAHRRFAVIMLDKAGNPATYNGCYTGSTCPKGGWHAVRIVRRSDGVIVENQFFDKDGQLIETLSCSKVPCFD